MFWDQRQVDIQNTQLFLPSLDQVSGDDYSFYQYTFIEKEVEQLLAEGHPRLLMSRVPLPELHLPQYSQCMISPLFL
jgi:hypothetical protein